MDAQRVPPSASMTSQSRVKVRGPSWPSSTEARSARPMSRWISWVRPLCLPLAASRADAGVGAPGQHPVLGGDPAARRAQQVRRHALLRPSRCRAPRCGRSRPGRALGVPGHASRGDGQRTELEQGRGRRSAWRSGSFSGRRGGGHRRAPVARGGLGQEGLHPVGDGLGDRLPAGPLASSCPRGWEMKPNSTSTAGCAPRSARRTAPAAPRGRPRRGRHQPRVDGVGEPRAVGVGLAPRGRRG